MKLKNKIYIGIIILLTLIAIFLIIQNFNLNKEVAQLNKDVEGAMDNFQLFLIEKFEKCESVMLMVGNKSALINEVHCEN